MNCTSGILVYQSVVAGLWVWISIEISIETAGHAVPSLRKKSALFDSVFSSLLVSILLVSALVSLSLSFFFFFFSF